MLHQVIIPRLAIQQNGKSTISPTTPEKRRLKSYMKSYLQRIIDHQCDICR